MSTKVIEGYQLSPQQKRSWQIEQELQFMFSRTRCSLLLSGDLDISALHSALQQVIEHHEILRTAFQIVPGMKFPLQVIQPSSASWQMYSNITQVEEHCSLHDFEMMQPYSEITDAAPTSHDRAKANLYMIGHATHILSLDMPDLWLDHQGIACLTSELMSRYAGIEQSYPEAVQYAAVAQWLDELIDEQEETEGKAFWRERLVMERSQIPFARILADGLHFQPQRLRSVLSPLLVEKIMSITHGADTDIQALLLACLTLLIRSLTNTENVMIGTSCDGRTEDDLRHIPGLLARSVPVVTSFASDQRFSQLWQQVAQSIQEAEEFQEYFDWNIVEQVSGHRLDYFPIQFAFRNMSDEYTAKKITCQLLDSVSYNDIFDIQVEGIRTKTGMSIDFHYNTAVLSQADTERLAAYFGRLLEAVVANIEGSISSFSIIDPAEQQLLLHDFVSGESLEPTQISLIESFEKQVTRTPGNIALHLQGDELTYSQLNAQANSVAHRLRQVGVRAGITVALCTERSLAAIVGLLGIFKAGGACVPLDPNFPADRQMFILRDSQSSIVVTQTKFSCLFEQDSLKIIDIDAEVLQKADHMKHGDTIDPEQIAYVIYTSGSTGQPKGVEVSHQAACHHFHTIQREFDLTEQDRVLQFASLSFDVALEQIFPTLLSGATIVMRGPATWSVAELNKTIVEKELTVINLTPAFWQQWSLELLNEPSVLDNNQVRLVIVGGDAMSLEALRAWHKTPLSACTLLNAYGPTEAVITATTFNVPQHFEAENEIKSVPIGRPLANREAYILNKQRQFMPTGLVGELYLGGLLARGYLNRPELTTMSFIDNPFRPGQDTHLYRTGDLGRYLPDGSIEYAGRIDQQVKIRGFRIELGEIEAVLQAHFEIQQAIVVPYGETSDEKRLVAYMLSQSPHPSSSGSIRQFLEARLPSYMIPSIFIWLDTLPMTPNGKLDRRALPKPDTTRPELDEAFLAPRNPIEEQLANIWRELLGVNDVGIHDNFFKLGGHSLVATQVIARVRSGFQIDLPVHILFQEPTIARLAEKIIQAKDENMESALPLIPRLQRRNSIGKNDTQNDDVEKNEPRN